MLNATNISQKYKKEVLTNVSFTAEGGEIVGVAGENGSGKSTLLGVLTGAARPRTGTVTVEGADISKDRRALARWVGYVPQDDSLFDDLTARDNLKFWAAAYRADWERALPYLFPGGEDGTRDFLSKKVRALSGGMRKRLSIGLSMMHSPRYLIMDEPSAGLDIGFKWSLMETMRRVKADGNCVIFTSHHPDELWMCDRLYVLRGGVFVYEGAPGGLADGEQSFGEALYRIIKPEHAALSPAAGVEADAVMV